MVLDETTEEERLFQTGIVLGKNEFFRESLKANCLVYCDSRDARVRLKFGAGVRYLKKFKEDRSLRDSRDGHSSSSSISSTLLEFLHLLQSSAPP